MLAHVGIILVPFLIMADPGETNPPLPTAIFQELDFFVGDWSLEGTGARGPMKSFWTMRWAPGKHCLIVDYRREDPETIIFGNALWGWDSATKEIVYHANFSDRGLEQVRSRIERPGVYEGTYTGSLDGKKANGTCELRKEGPNHWIFKTTGVATAGFEELDVRFTRVESTETDAKCPWKLVTGHWQLTDSMGDTSDVVWQQGSDDQSVVGAWTDKDGNKSTELVGWCPDQKVLVATAYGANGAYWQIRFTTVTETLVRGPFVSRQTDGSVFQGMWQVTRRNDDELPTLFVGTDKDGKKSVIDGTFKRVK